MLLLLDSVRKKDALAKIELYIVSISWRLFDKRIIRQGII